MALNTVRNTAGICWLWTKNVNLVKFLLPRNLRPSGRRGCQYPRMLLSDSRRVAHAARVTRQGCQRMG